MKETKNTTGSLDTPVDAVGTTQITDAASRQDWDKVYALLECGADARYKNTMGINALYYAVAYGNRELAEALYAAGARLDALNSVITESGSAAAALPLIAEFARNGKNLFFDENNTLVECCKWAEYKQASGLIDSAPAEELTKAVSELFRHGNYQTEENLQLIEKMVKAGGSIDLEVLDKISQERKPAVFQNPPEYIAAVRKIADSAQKE